jgi:hypothetical protein
MLFCPYPFVVLNIQCLCNRFEKRSRFAHIIHDVGTIVLCLPAKKMLNIRNYRYRVSLNASMKKEESPIMRSGALLIDWKIL